MLGPVTSLADPVRRYVTAITTEPWALGGLAVMRVIYAVAALHLYLTNYADRLYLWGPDAVYPYDHYRHIATTPLTLAYAVGTSRVGFEVVFHLGIAAAVAMLLGIGGRLGVFAHLVFHVSLYLRNPLVMDGGDNIAHIALLFLCLTNSTTILAVRLNRNRPARPARHVVVAAHNLAVIAIAFQVFVVYWASAMYKIQGRMWQDGVALYYILRVPEFSWPGVSELVYENRWLVFLLTWGTVWFQIAFPPMVLSRRFRSLILVTAIGFHLGIAILMNLWTFSLYMIGTEAVFAPSSWTDGIARRRLTAIRSRLGLRDRSSNVVGVGSLSS